MIYLQPMNISGEAADPQPRQYGVRLFQCAGSAYLSWQRGKMHYVLAARADVNVVICTTLAAGENGFKTRRDHHSEGWYRPAAAQPLVDSL